MACEIKDVSYSMPTVYMSRLAQAFIVSALVVSIGLHWAVLQSAAWVGMAVTYSVEKGSLTEGLSDTFDGAHPCPLCKAVDEGKRTDDKSVKTTAIKKFEMLVLRRVFIVPPHGIRFQYRSLDEWSLMRAKSPLLLPPRVGLV